MQLYPKPLVYSFKMQHMVSHNKTKEIPFILVRAQHKGRMPVGQDRKSII